MTLPEKLEIGPLTVLARLFEALAEPSRLALLMELRSGRRTVSELMAATGLKQANTSKQLGVLRSAGFVTRSAEGSAAYYSLSDASVFEVLTWAHDRLRAEAEKSARAFGALPESLAPPRGVS